MDEKKEPFENRIDLSDFSSRIDEMRAAIGKVLIGQRKTLDLMLIALLADGHVLLEGVPGVAKTLTAKLLARSLSVDFNRLQFTPDLMPSDVLGTSVFNIQRSEFEFKPGPIFGNIILVDEINRAPAKTQAALFEVMEERQVTIDGNTHKMKAPYLVLATQNPIEQEGTYRLPEAQLDRFLFKITMDYPKLDEEVAILERHTEWRGRPEEAINPIMKAEDIMKLRAILTDIRSEKPVLEYIAKIVDATRKDSSLYLGASPRASLALLYGSRAFAALQGRDFITPEDVKFLAEPVLAHRVLLSPEREMEGLSSADVIEQIVKKVEVPR